MQNWKKRYQQAHEHNFKKAYPQAYSAGLYCEPKYPLVKTSNGITKMITNYILWMGWRATRINVSGRLIDGVEKQPSGNVIGVKKWMPSTTRRGTADISATIKGRSVMMEIKVGNDKPSPYQLAEQQRERNAGGIYEFISTPEQFFLLYDFVLSL